MQQMSFSINYAVIFSPTDALDKERDFALLNRERGVEIPLHIWTMACSIQKATCFPAIYAWLC